MSEPVSDPLKPLDQVLEPDIRSTWAQVRDPETGVRTKTLADHHVAIAQVTLNEQAPLAVRQLFENAKNLVLYSWYFYRFHQPAELSGFGALEIALRERAKLSAPEWWRQAARQRLPSMKVLFEKAVKEGWIRNEEFSVWQHHQQFRAREHAVIEGIKKMEREGLEEIAIPELEEFVGVIGDESFDYLNILLETIPARRNNLAHGAETLHPQSLHTLKLCADIINQLFHEIR